MTIDEAIDIAWGIDKLRGGPRPTPQDVLERIDRQLATCGFNWLTGHEARRVLCDACSPRTDDPEDDSSHNKHAYELRIDGALLAKQRQWLLDLAEHTTRGREYLEGVIVLLDEIADRAHVHYGIDDLLATDVKVNDAQRTSGKQSAL